MLIKLCTQLVIVDKVFGNARIPERLLRFKISVEASKRLKLKYDAALQDGCLTGFATTRPVCMSWEVPNRCLIFWQDVFFPPSFR